MTNRRVCVFCYKALGEENESKHPCLIYLNGFDLKKGFLTDVSCSPFTAAYYLPRHLGPNPAYPHPYPYLMRGFPDTAALENRQTLFNDFITSQQMHSWPAAQRSDLLRGIPPRDQPLPLPFSAAPRGKAFVADHHILYWTVFQLAFQVVLQADTWILPSKRRVEKIFLEWWWGSLFPGNYF